MAFAKGHKLAKGRPKGTSNKATDAARHAIALFVDENAHRLQEWLDKIAEKDPQKAFDSFQSVIEYHIPKLARTTIEGDPDKPVHNKITVEVIQ